MLRPIRSSILRPRLLPLAWTNTAGTITVDSPFNTYFTVSKTSTGRYTFTTTDPFTYPRILPFTMSGTSGHCSTFATNNTNSSFEVYMTNPASGAATDDSGTALVFGFDTQHPDIIAPGSELKSPYPRGRLIFARISSAGVVSQGKFDISVSANVSTYTVTITRPGVAACVPFVVPESASALAARFSVMPSATGFTYITQDSGGTGAAAAVCAWIFVPETTPVKGKRALVYSTQVGARMSFYSGSKSGSTFTTTLGGNHWTPTSNGTGDFNLVPSARCYGAPGAVNISGRYPIPIVDRMGSTEAYARLGGSGLTALTHPFITTDGTAGAQDGEVVVASVGFSMSGET